ncbi:MAG: hypothetical protein ACJAYU_003989 [Bradymonadia bacterium]|jgi:hypothetical protein
MLIGEGLHPDRRAVRLRSDAMVRYQLNVSSTCIVLLHREQHQLGTLVSARDIAHFDSNHLL